MSQSTLAGDGDLIRASRARALGRLVELVPPPVLILVGMIAFQLGTATAKGLFDQVHPTGVSFARFLIAAGFLAALHRPKLRGIAMPDLRTLLGMGACMAVMNVLYFLAVSRLPLGIATALAFSGPFILALAGSRQIKHAVWVVLAAVGVILLAPWTSGDVDTLGFAMAGAAGCVFTAYIVLGRRAATSIPSGTGLTVPMLVAGLLLAPVGLATSAGDLLDPGVIPPILAVALLSTVIPYSVDYAALRRISAGLYAVLISLDPAVSALVGLVILDERIGTLGSIAIVLICTGSIGATWAKRGRAGAAG